MTLINPRARFVERIRLHQVAGGSDDAVIDFRDVLGERVPLVVDTVTRIDAGAHTVTLSSGGTLGYDYLIYAVGSGSADLAARSGLHTDSLGRPLTDETLTSVDDDRIIAAGDTSALEFGLTEPLRWRRTLGMRHHRPRPH